MVSGLAFCLLEKPAKKLAGFFIDFSIKSIDAVFINALCFFGNLYYINYTVVLNRLPMINTKQNPFSIYDFLGYLTPGAVFIYGYVLVRAHQREPILDVAS